MIRIPIEPKLTQYLHTKAALAGIPLNGTFELTPCCNLSCKMCYVRMTKQQQEAIRPLHTAKEWIALGKKARESGLLYLLLTGGEPFLHPQFREIITELSKLGLIISINSNGTMINEEVISWLKDVAPFRINITLYGASNETYERLCGHPHGFTQVTHAIRLLKEAGITVKINCSVTPYNAQDLEGIFAFAKKEGLVVQAASYMFPPLRRDKEMIGKNDRFSAEEAAYQQARIACYLNGEDDFLSRMKKNAPLVMNDVDEVELPKEGTKIRCRAGKCSFWITWDGRMLPCGIFPGEHAKNVFEEDFLHVWESVKKETDAIRMPAKCSSCNLQDQCKACAAMALTETGSFSKVPDYRCQMEQNLYGAYKKLEEELLARKKE